jgi:hypothetical protein
MSRSRHGKGGQRKAGAHKNRRSPEVQAWREVARADWLQSAESRQIGGRGESSKAVTTAPVRPIPPERPPWLDEGEYAALRELRARL